MTKDLKENINRLELVGKRPKGPKTRKNLGPFQQQLKAFVLNKSRKKFPKPNTNFRDLVDVKA